VLCSGTHPMTDWVTQDITADPRYAALLERNQWSTAFAVTGCSAVDPPFLP
jgi:gamma-glutamyl:cysteine ligase YbdK (ATP-grasp superfamily)